MLIAIEFKVVGSLGAFDLTTQLTIILRTLSIHIRNGRRTGNPTLGTQLLPEHEQHSADCHIHRNGLGGQ